MIVAQTLESSCFHEFAVTSRPRIPAHIDIASVRRRTGMSQEAFADHIGVSLFTLRGWEQGRRSPEGPARVLLAMLARNPNIVHEVLHADDE